LIIELLFQKYFRFFLACTSAELCKHTLLAAVPNQRTGHLKQITFLLKTWHL